MSGGIDLDCGIAMARIANWLENELCLPREGEAWIFSDGAHSCTVRLQPLAKRPLGAVFLERTRLTVNGDGEALEVFDKVFTLRFMSAGG